MKIYELQRKGTDILKASGIDNAAYDSRALIKYVFDMDETGLIINGSSEAEDDKTEEYLKLVGRRAEHYPLQYLMHSTGFMDYSFYVDENVLIPRSDTEILVEEVLKYIDRKYVGQSIRILDMCTGSGCIGISCFLERKENGVTDDVTLADISDNALEVAAKNAAILGADVNIVRSDIYEAFSDKSPQERGCVDGNISERSKEGFDIIISNPPYIRSSVIPTLMEEVKDHEPILALDGDEDGLKFYRRIIEGAPEYLRENGAVFLEIGYDQYEDTRKLLVDAGFGDIKLYKDLAGLDRVVCGRLM